MTIELVRDFLGWCTIINLGILIWWFLFFILAHDFMYRFQTRWFKISVERFDEIHYSSMALFKLGIFIFNLVPYLAFRIVGV